MSLYDSASLYDNGTTFDGYPAGLATQPVIGVFIAFNDGAYVAEPDWVEVTQYVRNINVRRGRSNELQAFPPSTASVTLDNRTQLFNPFNTGGALYGKLEPRRQIKIVAQWAGVNYPMFRGYTAGWPVQETDAGKDSTVTLDCFDALALLAAEKTASDPLYVYTLSLSPTDYWRCSDNAASVVLVNEIRDRSLLSQYAPNPKFSSVDALQTTLKTSAANIYEYRTTIVQPPASPTLVPASHSLAFWAKGATSYSPQVQLLRGDIWMIVTIDATQVYLTVYYAKTSSGTRYQTTPYRLSASDPHYYVATWDKDTSSPKLYVDGLDVTGVVSTTTGTKSNVEYELFLYGVYQHCSVFNYVLSASQVLALYQFGAEQILETTTARASRILSDSSFPLALVSLPATPVETVSEVTTDSTTLNELQEVADSEGGELYVDRAGVLTFVDRDYFAELTRCNTSQMTFTDIGTGVGYDSDSLQMSYDADVVRNSVEIKFTNGGSTISRNPTSIAANGEAGASISTLIATSANATTLANRLLNQYKNPKLRVDPFSVNGGRDPSYAWPRLLSLELLDRFTFKRSPSGGSSINTDMLLQSVEHNVSPGSWVTSVNGSSRSTGWFVVGVSLIGGTDVLL